MKKRLAIILSIAIIISSLPTISFAAVSNKHSNFKNNINFNVETSELSDVIVNEIVSERTEYTKTYLMNDGTYCDIISPFPIHTIVDNAWEDVSLFQNEELNSIDEACTIFSQSNQNNVYSYNENNRTLNSTGTFEIFYNASSQYSNSINSFNNGNVALIKSEILNSYLENNEVVMAASLKMNCHKSSPNKQLRISVYEENNEWPTQGTSIPSGYTSQKRLLDYYNMPTNLNDDIISLDITDLYCRWEKGINENKGLILQCTSSRCSADLSNICMCVQYKKVYEMDSNFTYREEKINQANSIFINDFTGIPTVVQDVIYNDHYTDLNVQLLYNAALLEENSNVLPFTRINYDSQIEIYRDPSTNLKTLMWKMPNGDVKFFIQPENVVSENGFELWEEENPKLVSEIAIAKIDEDAIDSLGDNTSYYLITIDYCGYIFEFSDYGYLKKIRKENSEVLINRDIDGISKIIDPYGVSYNFSYASYENNKYLRSITVTSSTGLILAEQTISFENNDGNSIFTFNYSDGNELIYEFDSNNRLTEIKKCNSEYMHLEYLNDADGNILQSYTNYKDEDTYLTTTLDFSQTFQRKYVLSGSAESEEMLHFDRELKLITHCGADETYTCASYSNDALLTTYSFNKHKTNFVEKINDSTFDAPNDNYWQGNNGAIYFEEDGELRINGVLDRTVFVYQQLETEEASSAPSGDPSRILLKRDQTYVLKGEGKAITAVPKEERFFGIVLDLYTDYEDDEPSYTVELPFDTCISGEWQFRMKAFKLDEDIEYAEVKLIYSDQSGTGYFDNISLFEGQALTDVESIGGNSIYLYEADNDNVFSEYMTDGVLTLKNSFEYYNDSKNLKSVKDLFGVKTEYEYIGNKTIERVKSGSSENPIDIYYKEIQYSNDLITQVSTTITNILNNANVDILNSYTYNNDQQISSITHNGIVYDYNYSGGLLTEINMHQADELSDSSQNLISYGYSGKTINSISYANGWTILYTLDSKDNPTLIEYHDSNNDVVKSYIYTYDNNILKSVYDSISGLKYVFAENGCYEIYQYEPNSNGTTAINNHPIKFYAKEMLENGDVKHTYYRPIMEGVNGDTGLSITTVGGTMITDSALGRTKSSEINISKISAATSNDEMFYYNYQRSSQRDYFGRLTQKQMNLTLSNSRREEISQNSTNCTYEYYTDESNTTYNLPEYYNYAITSSYNNTTSLFSLRLKFVYDEKGNLNYVYQSETLSDGTMSELRAVKRYEYDAANQLILEIDLLSNIYAKYTYDAGMNLTSKVYFDFDSSNIDITAENPQYYGTPYGLVFNYNNDRLISISEYIADDENGEAANTYLIQYDDLGNPLNYVGYGEFGDNEAELKWMGNNLVEYSTGNNVFKYSYDANGYRISKEMYERKSNGDLELKIRFIYVWDNGILTGFIFNVEEISIHTDIIYDQEGVPAGIVVPSGLPYYFVYDNNGNITEMVNIQNESICSLRYDSFGTVIPTIYEEGLSGLVPVITLMFLPCTYHGCIYDFESGFYFNKGRCYSPTWGRYLNPEYTEPIAFDANDIGASNFYLYCDNNPVNNFEEVSVWSRDYQNAKLFGEDFAVLETEMSVDFMSRPFCAIYANEIIRRNGKWTLEKGNSYKGLNVVDIAATLFAKSTGNYAMAAVNKVNASWGDGWIQNNSNSSTIKVYEKDPNIDKYIAIWYRAEDIRNYAILDGIIITL